MVIKWCFNGRQAAEDIRTTCTKITIACQQIKQSAGFAAVLQRLLVVGNAMNAGKTISFCLGGVNDCGGGLTENYLYAGTHRGQAAGFSLESLLKITQTKASAISLLQRL